MKQYIKIIILALCVASCSQHSNQWETLAQIESFIEERPDSALAILQEMDAHKLSSNEEKAKHALLRSMALDKNVIDKTDFEILQPAIDYYENNGSPTDKLRTLYYQGRIYQNQGRNNLAMESFVEGLHKGEASEDLLTKARLLFTQARLYNSLFEWDKAADAYSKSGEYFKTSDRINSYMNCIVSIINVYTLTKDKENVRNYIHIAKEDLSDCNTRMKGTFYSSYLMYLTTFERNNKNIIAETINEYLNSIEHQYIDWLSIANAYVIINDAENAMKALAKHSNFSNVELRLRYNAILADAYELNKEYSKALLSYKNYIALSDSLEYTRQPHYIFYNLLGFKDLQVVKRSPMYTFDTPL